MIRCRTCIYPSSRPDAGFDDTGECSACRSYKQRALIDWSARMDALKMLLSEARQRNAPYDCVVPVSGGKDSMMQVITLRDLGARVLAVNAATDYLTPLGRRNLDNIKRFCDVIEWTPNIEVRKKLVRIGLRVVGDMSLPEHMAIWAIPTRVACQMQIPLVVWGEQPQREYATPNGVEPATRLDQKWVHEFGGLLGLRLADMVGMEGLTKDDLSVFRFPSDDQLAASNTQGIWLGDYIDWDGWRNAFIAQQYGFECAPHPVETSCANYENLDSYVTVLRDYIRFRKYSYTRGTDILCNHVRRGRLDRETALRLEATTTGFPKTSLGKPIEEVLAYFGITLDEFHKECEKWASQ